MSNYGPKRQPSPGGEGCSACPNFLTAREVRLQMRRCRQCCVGHPRQVQPKEAREAPRCPVSWWADKDLPREGLTALAWSQRDRMRRGINYYSAEAMAVANKRMVGRMHHGE